MVFATVRALIAAVLMFPLGWWVLGQVSITWGAVPAVAMFLILGSLVGSAVGLTLGTLVTASKINLVFAIVLTPLLFTGSTQFPWRSLQDLRWFQVICAFNPLTYVSEGMRAEMVPGLDHIPVWVCTLALLGHDRSPRLPPPRHRLTRLHPRPWPSAGQGWSHLPQFRAPAPAATDPNPGGTPSSTGAGPSTDPPPGAPGWRSGRSLTR